MAKSFNDLPAVVQAVILAALAIGLAAGYFFMGIPGVANSVWSLSKERDRLQAEVDRLHQENLKNQALEREQEELKNRIAQLQRQLARLRTIVPDDQATDEFVKMVYDTARGSSIYLRNFVAGPLVQRQFYVEMPFTVKLDGTYYQMLEFFNRLARQTRIVSVVNLSLSGGPGTGPGKYAILPSETVEANCTIMTFFNRPPQPPPAQAQPPR